MIYLLFEIILCLLYDDYIVLFVECTFIFEEGWAVSRSPRGRNLNFRGAFFPTTSIFTAYSSVPASGIARRDPPRHVDVIIQILIKIRLM